MQWCECDADLKDAVMVIDRHLSVILVSNRPDALEADGTATVLRREEYVS